MRKLSIPLLAALALPTAVNAESYWLILESSHNNWGFALEKIEVNSMSSCEKQGESWKKSWKARNYWCIIGK